jgi:hypothetical protein
LAAVIALNLIAALVVGAATNPAALAHSPLRRPTVWLVGDSITRQYSPLLSARHPGWDVVDLGVGGETSPRGLCRVRGLFGLASAPSNWCSPPQPVLDPPREAPDVAVVLFGANDFNFSLSYEGPVDDPMIVEQAHSNLVQIARLFSDRGTSAVIGLPFSVRSRPDLHEYPADISARVHTYWRMQDELRAALMDDGLQLVDFMAPSVRYFEGRENPPYVHASAKGIRFLSRRASASIRVALKARRR